MKRVKIDRDIAIITWLIINNPPQGEGYKGEHLERGVNIRKKLKAVGLKDILMINEIGLEILKPYKDTKDWQPKKTFIDFEDAEHLIIKNFLKKTIWTNKLEEADKTMKAFENAENLNIEEKK